MTHSPVLIRRLLGTLSVVGFSTVAYAVAEISLPNNDDIYFREPVQIPGVETIVDEEAQTSTSTLTLSGAGTLTVANSKYGEYPRIGLRGGTRITMQEYGASIPGDLEPWDGTIEPVIPMIVPTQYDILFLDDHLNQEPGKAGMDVIAAYRMYGAHQSISFSPAAQFAFRVDQPNGTRLFTAKRNPDGAWTSSQNSFCIVQDNTCQITSENFGSMALVKPIYSSCPVADVENGRITEAPDCRLYCDNNFTADASATQCVAKTSAATTEADLDAELMAELQASSIDFDSAIPPEAEIVVQEPSNDTPEAEIEEPLNSSAMTTTQTIQQLTGELYMPGGQASQAVAVADKPTTPDVKRYGTSLSKSGPGPFLIIALFGLLLMLFGSTRRV